MYVTIRVEGKMFSILDYGQMEVLPGLNLFFHNELYTNGNTFTTLVRERSAA